MSKTFRNDKYIIKIEKEHPRLDKVIDTALKILLFIPKITIEHLPEWVSVVIIILILP